MRRKRLPSPTGIERLDGRFWKPREPDKSEFELTQADKEWQKIKFDERKTIFLGPNGTKIGLMHFQESKMSTEDNFRAKTDLPGSRGEDGSELSGTIISNFSVIVLYSKPVAGSVPYTVQRYEPAIRDCTRHPWYLMGVPRNSHMGLPFCVVALSILYPPRPSHTGPYPQGKHAQAGGGGDARSMRA